MALNIKNPETNRLARELAALKGVSVSAAVAEAVKEKLDREKAQQSGNEKEVFAEWLMKISRETAPLMADGKTSTDLLEELYDKETGLPI